MIDVMLPQEQRLVGISQVCCSSQLNKWFSHYHGTRAAKRRDLCTFESGSKHAEHFNNSWRGDALSWVHFFFFLPLLWTIVPVTPEACCLHLKTVSWQAPHLACSQTQTHPAHTKKLNQSQTIKDNFSLLLSHLHYHLCPIVWTFPQLSEQTHLFS